MTAQRNLDEIKWDIKRGKEVYRSIYSSRLRGWILKGKIKAGEVLVYRSGFSGWRKPEELEELNPYFKKHERSVLQLANRSESPGPELTIEKKTPSEKTIKNIMIIDDEQDLCYLLSDILTKKEYVISASYSIKMGIEAIKQKKTDLIFLDLHLPDGNALDFIPKIKKINPDILINIITAYGSEENKKKAFNNGVNAFIDKPFTEEEIINSIT